jgi:hypothetical protein
VVDLGVGKFLLRSISGDRGKTDGVGGRKKIHAPSASGDDMDAPSNIAYIGDIGVRTMDRRIAVVSKFRPNELARDVRSLDDVSLSTKKTNEHTNFVLKCNHSQVAHSPRLSNELGSSNITLCGVCSDGHRMKCFPTLA